MCDTAISGVRHKKRLQNDQDFFVELALKQSPSTSLLLHWIYPSHDCQKRFLVRTCAEVSVENVFTKY